MAEKFSSEAARDRAEQAGITLAEVEGTGADGAAKVEDVEKAIEIRQAAAPVPLVVNPRLDAAEYEASDGRRFYRDLPTLVDAAESDALRKLHYEGVQVLVKGDA